MIRVELWTDGACSGNGRPDAAGGWGLIMRKVNTDTGAIILEKEFSGTGPVGTTNNVMELAGVYEGLRRLSPSFANKPEYEFHIYADSKYVIDTFTNWIFGWELKKFKGVKNVELIKAIQVLAKLFAPEWHWVKGHAGNDLNERVDRLAVMAKKRAYQPADCLELDTIIGRKQ